MVLFYATFKYCIVLAHFCFSPRNPCLNLIRSFRLKYRILVFAATGIRHTSKCAQQERQRSLCHILFLVVELYCLLDSCL